MASAAELWAASKIIGRECATVNKEFFLCKKRAGDEPAACESQSVLSSLCANKTIELLKKDFGAEFAPFASCLDKNDFRFGDCRKTQAALLDAWNTKHSLTPKEA